MESTLNSRKLKSDFEVYIGKVFLKNLTLILGVSVLILSYYLYSDWVVRNNLWAVLTRVFPLTLIIGLLVVHLNFPKKFYRFKYWYYILIYIAVQLMMYGKCMIHLHEDALAPSVTGTILVIFIISLDVKQNIRLAALIYALPITLFTILLFLVGKPSGKEFLVLADIYPIVVIGFIINRIQFKLRFRLFESNQLLKLEKNKTSALYNETLVMNHELESKAKEANLIKEEIQVKNEELQKSNATKDKFLGIIAHDLKNPIGAIWGLSNLLLQDEDIDKEQKQSCIETINECIKNTYDLLDNLLTWARAQNNALVYEPIVLNAHNVVENELNVLKSLSNKKHITIENFIPNDIGVYADQFMLETILRNLISNAIKFSFVNGIIKINAQRIVRDQKRFVEITVEDFGTGMNEDKLSRIFKITKNVSTRGTNNEEGTGLGLLLCKEFIDMHKGTISVTSQPNAGSLFRCEFLMLN